MATPLRILFVASECASLAKTGGLGDVVSGLTRQLKREGHDVRIFMPLYDSIDRARHHLNFDLSLCVHMGGNKEFWCGVYQGLLEGEVPVQFLEYQGFFGRPGIYDFVNREYADNPERFAFFSKACLQWCKDSGFIPDVVHVHDWPGSPVPAFLKTWDRILSPLSATASVLTIHNIGYQGVYPGSVFPFMGLSDDCFNAEICEDHGRMNYLKLGVHYADAITTVSPTHAGEILSPDGGRGLAPFLNARSGDLSGILNGADYSEWSPETDRWIPATYSADDLSGKAECRRKLRERLGLTERDCPILGIVSRFVEQKGLHLASTALDRLLPELDFQVAVLGSGDPGMESYYGGLPSRFPGWAGCHIGFSNELSHWIQAGCDFFLVPSLYEPCGLTQIYSLRYGTPPIVRATGGLVDTVQPYDPETDAGTGFLFTDPTAEGVEDGLRRAFALWHQSPEKFRRLQERGMREDFSWEKPAALYLEVYQHAMENRRRLQETDGAVSKPAKLAFNPMLARLR